MSIDGDGIRDKGHRVTSTPVPGAPHPGARNVNSCSRRPSQAHKHMHDLFQIDAPSSISSSAIRPEGCCSTGVGAASPKCAYGRGVAVGALGSCLTRYREDPDLAHGYNLSLLTRDHHHLRPLHHLIPYPHRPLLTTPLVLHQLPTLVSSWRAEPQHRAVWLWAHGLVRPHHWRKRQLRGGA